MGKECVGKSQLVASLTGRFPEVANFSGTTVAVEECEGEGCTFLDAPGILRLSDTETTRLALARLRREDVVLVVAQATHLDEDLADLLPLVAGKRGAVAVTFWDKVAPTPGADEALRRPSAEAGVPFVPIDARRLSAAGKQALLAALDEPAPFGRAALLARAGWRIAPRDGLFERKVYQLPATLAVPAATGRPGLSLAFLALLGGSTLAFLRLLVPRPAAAGADPLVLARRVCLVWPRPQVLWREARTTLAHLFLRALPVFFGITLVASLLDLAAVVLALVFAWAGALLP